MQQCQVLATMIIVITILIMEFNQIAWQKAESTISAFLLLPFKQVST
ncbi:hypothetical protein [Leptothermofonsia sp. ETS-13]